MSLPKTSSTYVLYAVAVMYALVASVVGAEAPREFVSPPDSAHPQAVESKSTEFRKGVTLKRLVFEKPRRMVAYVARVDLTLPGIRFIGTERDPLWGRPMPDYTNETWLINTKRETTADFMMRRRGEGRNVEIAVNTSGWRPWGGRVACNSTYATFYRWDLVDGVEISHGKKPSMGTYFIVRKNGKVEIRSRIRPSMTNDMVFAVYGNRHLLKNGAPTPDAAEKFNEIHPRTAFGLSRDRKTLVILVVDGRQPDYSEGATRADLADILLREGCADAVNMDGGGSSSLVVYDRKNDRPLMLNHHANGYVRKTALNLGLIFPAERKSNEPGKFIHHGNGGER